MPAKTNLAIKIGSALFGLLALFHISIGAYHTVLYATLGRVSMFTDAYGIAASPADMQDPARFLGSDAIEVYSVLLLGYGVLSLWAIALTLRGDRLGFWLNTIIVGVAEVAITYALVLPGHLTGANGWASPVMYALAVIATGIGVWRQRGRGPARGRARIGLRTG
jgi:hypothetical protein